MELNIAELMSGYADEEFEPVGMACADVERVRALVLQKIALPRRTKRKYVVFIAAALLLLCAACAVVVRTLSFGQFTPAMRALLFLEAAEEVPASVEYESVTETESARYADVSHEGRGELYMSASIRRSEDILLVSLMVSTVTSEQTEELVWRAREVGGDTYYIVEKQGERTDGSCWFQMAMPTRALENKTLNMELCAGTESADGSCYQIERVGVFHLEVGEWESVLAYDFDPAVELYDESGTEILGWLKHAEWNDGLLLVEIEYNGTAPDEEDMAELLAWGNGIRPQLCGSLSVVFASGESLPLYYADGLWRGNCYMLSLDLPPRLENEQPAALGVNGTEYALMPVN